MVVVKLKNKDEEITEPCPYCGADLKEKWSGVECTMCDYWFCY